MADLHRRTFACALSLALSACSFDHGKLSPDAAPDQITVSFGRTATMTDEASGTIMIPVSLSASSTATITVDYTVTDGTASRPEDFTLAAERIEFLPGQTEKSIDVGIEMDTIEESDETIVVTLTGATGASLGSTLAHTVTISSDILPRVSFMNATPSSADEATSPQVTLSLTLPPKQSVTVELGVAGTATIADHGVSDGQLVTFQPNETSKVVPLGVVQDALDEDDEMITLTLQNPSAMLLLASSDIARTHTITDDDPLPTVAYTAVASTTGETQSIDLTVQLAPQSGRAVTVDYAMTAGTASSADATVTGAPGTLTFMPGQTSRTITVTVANDTLDEPDETVAVTLSNAINATLGANAVNTLTITDDDDPPQVSFTLATTNVNEAMAMANVNVELTAASGFDVTVPFTVAGTADTPDDYSITGSSVLIPAGMTSASIAVAVEADGLDETNETVIVTLGTPTNATPGAITMHTLTINDDDPPPTVAFTSIGSTPNEANSTITLTVQLSAISGRDVTVPYTIDAASTASNPADYTISPAASVVIAAGQTSTTIQITMNEDALNEVDETVIVTLDTPTNATLGTPATYTLTIRNEDPQPNVSWNPAESNITEPEGTSPPGPATRTVTYTLVLSAASGQTVTVAINYGGSATFNTDYSGPTMVSFAPGATTTDVTLTIQKDSTKENPANETIIMSFGTVTNAGTANPTQRTHTLQDDD